MKDKNSTYDEAADYNYDIMPNGVKNPKRFNGYWRPEHASHDIFWWLKIFNNEELGDQDINMPAELTLF